MKIIRNVVIVIVSLMFICNLFDYIAWNECCVYELQPIDEYGNYVLYDKVTSDIPSNNYETIHVCHNNNVYNYNGDVTIRYTNDAPRINIQKSNIANGDKYEVFIPECAIVYNE